MSWETTYVENSRTGEVHRTDCPRVKVIAHPTSWSPERAPLLPGRRACWVCLENGLPLRTPAPEPRELLEDPDGAPYPEEVQALVALLQIDHGTAGMDALVAALEAVAWYAWRDGAGSGSKGVYEYGDNPHPLPRAEGGHG